jgi:hypothetical protein
VSDTIGSALSVVHFLVVFVTQNGIAVVGNQIRKGHRSLDDAVGVLVEHFKKIALCGQQLSK